MLRQILIKISIYIFCVLSWFDNNVNHNFLKCHNSMKFSRLNNTMFFRSCSIRTFNVLHSKSSCQFIFFLLFCSVYILFLKKNFQTRSGDLVVDITNQFSFDYPMDAFKYNLRTFYWKNLTTLEGANKETTQQLSAKIVFLMVQSSENDAT